MPAAPQRTISRSSAEAPKHVGDKPPRSMGVGCKSSTGRVSRRIVGGVSAESSTAGLQRTKSFVASPRAALRAFRRAPQGQRALCLASRKGEARSAAPCKRVVTSCLIGTWTSAVLGTSIVQTRKGSSEVGSPRACSQGFAAILLPLRMDRPVGRSG